MFDKVSKEVPRKIEVKGRAIKCPVCGNDLFWSREAQLNTAVATFFNFDWANRSANCYVCTDCTYIYWFLDKKDQE